MKKFKLESILYNKYMIYFFIFFILSGCCYFDFNPMVNEVVKIISYFSTFIVVLFYLLNAKCNKFTITFLTFCFFMAFSCIIGDEANIINFFKMYHGVVAIVLYLDWGIRYNCKEVLRSLENVLFCLITINFITILLYPDGLFSSELYTRNWFLQYDNLHILLFLPALLISIINLKMDNKKMSLGTLLLFVMVAYSVFYCFSANTVFAFTIFVVYLLLRKYIDKIDFLNSKTYFILYLFVFMIIVAFRLQEEFSWLIIDILHKNLTFTGRTYIWDNVVDFIKQKPILGYGIENSETYSMKLGSKYYTHAHNTMYDVLYKGGAVSLLLFSCVILIPVRELYKYRDNKLAKLVAYTLFCFLIMMIFEARQEKIGLYIILVIAVNIKSIVEYVEERKVVLDEGKQC